MIRGPKKTSRGVSEQLGKEGDVRRKKWAEDEGWIRDNEPTTARKFLDTL